MKPTEIVLVAVIREHVSKHGASPTFREIATAAGLSKSHVARLVASLVLRKLLVRFGVERSLSLPGACPACGRSADGPSVP